MLMLFINGPSFQYYNTNKKSDVAVETVIDLNTEEIKQKIEAAPESLEEEHYKGIKYILKVMKVVAQKKIKMIIDFKAFILNIK